MGLMVEWHKDGAYLVVLCDQCHEPINKTTNGNFVFDGPVKSKRSAVSFTHKECDRAFQRRHPERAECWGSISDLPTLLSGTITHTQKRETSHAD